MNIQYVQATSEKLRLPKTKNKKICYLKRKKPPFKYQVSINTINTTYKLCNNSYHARGSTYQNNEFIRDNKEIVILLGDKESSVVIMNKNNYNKKVDGTINERIQQVKYEESDTSSLKELESVHSFVAISKIHPIINKCYLLTSTSTLFCHCKNSQIWKN